MIVLDDLALFLAAVLRNEPSPPKNSHFRKPLKDSLLFRARRIDGASRGPKIVEEKSRPDYASQLPHGKVQAILATVRAEPAKMTEGVNFPALIDIPTRSRSGRSVQSAPVDRLVKQGVDMLIPRVF